MGGFMKSQKIWGRIDKKAKMQGKPYKIIEIPRKFLGG